MIASFWGATHIPRYATHICWSIKWVATAIYKKQIVARWIQTIHFSVAFTLHGYKAVDEFTPISGELIGEWWSTTNHQVSILLYVLQSKLICLVVSTHFEEYSINLDHQLVISVGFQTGGTLHRSTETPTEDFSATVLRALGYIDVPSGSQTLGKY